MLSTLGVVRDRVGGNRAVAGPRARAMCARGPIDRIRMYTARLDADEDRGASHLTFPGEKS